MSSSLSLSSRFGPGSRASTIVSLLQALSRLTNTCRTVESEGCQAWKTPIFSREQRRFRRKGLRNRCASAIRPGLCVFCELCRAATAQLLPSAAAGVTLHSTFVSRLLPGGAIRCRARPSRVFGIRSTAFCRFALSARARESSVCSVIMPQNIQEQKCGHVVLRVGCAIGGGQRGTCKHSRCLRQCASHSQVDSKTPPSVVALAVSDDACSETQRCVPRPPSLR